MPKKTDVEEPIPKDLFDILACPLCRGNLEYTDSNKGLVCSNCGAKYPIEDGIPNLLPPKEKKAGIKQ